MSTIDKSIMKLLLKVLQEGSKVYDPETKEKLQFYSKKLIDREKHKELDDLFEGLFGHNETTSNLNDFKRINYPNTNIFLVFSMFFYLNLLNRKLL